MIVLGTAVAYPMIELFRNSLYRLRNGNLYELGVAAQSRLAEQLTDRTVRWSIAPGSVVAFVGNGEPLARQIAPHKPGDIVQIAQ